MKILQNDGSEIWIQVPSGEKTVIDAADAWIMETFPCWGITGSASRYIFAERGIKTEYSTVRERIYLHRLVMLGKRLLEGERLYIDHIDRDRLNNRRANLRFATISQNGANSIRKRSASGYRGVRFAKERTLAKGWCAYGKDPRKRDGCMTIGYFKTAEEAARAYDAHALKIYGEFAILNFPDK